jgi:hypothetical protein
MRRSRNTARGPEEDLSLHHDLRSPKTTPENDIVSAFYAPIRIAPARRCKLDTRPWFPSAISRATRASCWLSPWSFGVVFPTLPSSTSFRSAHRSQHGTSDGTLLDRTQAERCDGGRWLRDNRRRGFYLVESSKWRGVMASPSAHSHNLGFNAIYVICPYMHRKVIFCVEYLREQYHFSVHAPTIDIFNKDT